MPIDGNTPITLILNLESVQTIMSAIGSQPYDKVANLVNIIQRQASQQIQALQTPDADPAANEAPASTDAPAAE